MCLWCFIVFRVVKGLGKIMSFLMEKCSLCVKQYMVIMDFQAL